jgi:hypothetical protein
MDTVEYVFGGPLFIMVATATAAVIVAMNDLRPPPRGRAPGWEAGLEVARRRSASGRGHPESLKVTPIGD